MNQKVFSSIIASYKLEEIEKHLVYSYIKFLDIDYSECIFMNSYLNEDFLVNSDLCKEIVKLDCNSLKELERYLELLIPTNDRKINGAFFTPTYIVDYIIKEVNPQPNDTNLDPSCGCGAFLIGLIDYYKRTYNKSVKDTVKENVFGSDVLEYNIKRAKLLISIYALQNGETLEEEDFNLYYQDSLRASWGMQFDNIVGNPPYVKFQDLSDENRAYLLSEWETINKGTFNLYFAFFELGYKLLKQGGELSYITPNNYFTSLAGESIRNYFNNNKCIKKIVDFASEKVFDVQTYTAITFMQKVKMDFILFDRITKGKKPEDYLKTVGGSINYYENLNPKKWRLLKKEEQDNIRRIETIGTPIGKLFDICVGIATLKDNVFFLEGKASNDKYYTKVTDKGVFQIEKEITRPVYKISDFKTQNEIELNHRRIICPYITKNGSTAILISEDIFAEKYPKCYEFLLSEKDALMSRDKGKAKYSAFYAWGRTQGLNKFGKKILNPTFSQTPRFLKAEEEDAFFTNGYGIFFKKEENYEQDLFGAKVNPLTQVHNIEIVQKILNSSLMHYYITNTSVSIEGGYPCYQKNFIENFTIPDFTDQEIKTLGKLNSYEDVDKFLLSKYQINLPAPNLVL